MFEAAKRIQEKLVGAGADAFWKAAPWIFLVLGLMALLVAHIFIDKEQQKLWHNFVVGTGSLVLSAGVFAVVLKSFQYIKVFREELLNIFRDTEFANVLAAVVRPTPSSIVELRGLVEPLVERFAQTRQNELSQGALIELRQLLAIFEQDSFFRNFSRTIRIQSFDPKTHTMLIEDELFIELVPRDALATTLYSSSISSQHSSFSLGTLDVNGENYSKHIELTPTSAKYDLRLSGSGVYRIRRKYTKTLDVKADPYINLRLTKPALDLDLRVENTVPDAVNVIVRGVGFNTLDPRANFAVTTSSESSGSKFVSITRLSKRSLTLPDNGYFIIFGIK